MCQMKTTVQAQQAVRKITEQIQNMKLCYMKLGQKYMTVCYTKTIAQALYECWYKDTSLNFRTTKMISMVFWSSECF